MSGDRATGWALLTLLVVCQAWSWIRALTGGDDD